MQLFGLDKDFACPSSVFHSWQYSARVRPGSSRGILRPVILLIYPVFSNSSFASLIFVARYGLPPRSGWFSNIICRCFFLIISFVRPRSLHATRSVLNPCRSLEVVLRTKSPESKLLLFGSSFSQILLCSMPCLMRRLLVIFGVLRDLRGPRWRRCESMFRVASCGAGRTYEESGRGDSYAYSKNSSHDIRYLRQRLFVSKGMYVCCRMMSVSNAITHLVGSPSLSQQDP